MGIILIDNFGDWCVKNGGLTEGSANSYKSYLNDIRDFLIEKTGIDIFTIRPSKVNDGISLEVLQDIFESIILKELTVNRCKKLQDGLSAFRKYMEYLNEFVEDECDFADFETPIGQPFVSEFLINKNSILRKVKSRLRTQDRLPSKGLLFPIRVTGSIFRQAGHDWDKKFKDWLNGVASNISIIISEKGDTVTIGQIDDLSTDDDGAVSCRVGDKEYDVYTKTAKGEIQRMYANDMSQITIDHKTPISKVLHDCESEFPRLAELSDYYKKHAGNIKTSDMAKSIINDIKQSNTDIAEFLCGLLDELKKISDKTLCELMHEHENKSKGGVNRHLPK